MRIVRKKHYGNYFERGRLMKRIGPILLVFILVFSCYSVTLAKPQSQSSFVPKLPDYQKVDADLAKELKAKGQKTSGKELHNINGKAYMKPQDSGSLDYKNVDDLKTKGIAIVVDFPVESEQISDVPGVDYDQLPIHLFDDLINGDTYDPYQLEMFKNLAQFNGQKASTNRTMKNFYNEASYGKFSMDIDVAGWYELPHSYEYYLGQNKGYYNENGDAHIAELVKDAINLASQDVDFSQYAVDAQPGDFWLHGNNTTFVKDGQEITKIVPNLLIIHRGTGAEFSLDPSLIWSHKWDITSAGYYGDYYQTGQVPDESSLDHFVVDGVALDTYNIVPEVGQDITGYLKVSYPDLVGPDYVRRAPSPPYVGVFAHEFGHVLGLPDFYDYGYDSEGIGMFSLMAGGSYGRDLQDRYYSGNTPVHPDAWSKTFLGFADPIEVIKDSKLTLRPSVHYPDIYKVVVPGSNGREYFLLENRQQTGFDAGLAYNMDGSSLHGLVVYHVVEDILVRNNDRPNEAQNWDNNHLGLANFMDKGPYATGEHHYAVSVLQADGQYNLERYVNDGDAGDVFPGKYNVTSILDKAELKLNTTSLYKWGKANTETGIVFNNIVEKEDGTISLSVLFKKK
jgi:immune inhibitor A